MRNKLSVRNVLFPVVMCLLLCGPGLLFVAGRMDASLPSWLTAEDATYLSGGIKYPDVVGELSLEGFASGDLQQAIEDEVGNYIPAKGALCCSMRGCSMRRYAPQTSSLVGIAFLLSMVPPL